ncbi:MAG: VWA domain-containing protein [Helicobacteraceae bacterium]|nr:VWA domain-containing protein [Candidatus Sulfurimonas ponti]
MSFLRPEILYFLLPLVAILFGLLLTQKETQEHFFSKEVMKKLQVSANTLTLKVRNIFFFLVIVLIVIALAGPIIEDGEVEVKSKSADIMIALDISDSMLAEDVYPNRLRFAKQKAMDLLKMAPDERIGVVAFAKNSYLVSPMSFDHNAVRFLLGKLSTDSITEKGTDFSALLDVVNKTIKKETKKYLLILSDGGDKDDFSAEIAYAKEKNIVIFILGIGTTKGAPVKKEDGSFIKRDGNIIVSKLNENISKLATESSGVYIQSIKSNADIKTMLEEIEAISEQKQLKSETVRKFIPLFYYPLGLALLLLLVATSSLYKKEKLTSPLVALLAVFAFFAQDANAGILDFMNLDKAESAYENEDYNTSAKIYSDYAQSSQNVQSYFNAGNALYKQEKYDEAIQSYEKAYFENNVSEANKYGNIGNAYVKQSTQESLEKAVKSYEKSLEFNEDEEIRENLEAVKKALEKQKKEQEQKQDDKEQKEEQGEEENKEKQDQEKQDKEDSQEGEKSDEKDESQEKSESADDKDKSEDKKSEEEKSGEEKEKDEEEKQEEKKLDELKKDEEETKEEQAGAPLADGKENMSDAEEEKWIQKLNDQQNTFMYKLNDNQMKEEKSDEIPW